MVKNQWQKKQGFKVKAECLYIVLETIKSKLNTILDGKFYVLLN